MTTTPADMICENELYPNCLRDDATTPMTRRVDWATLVICIFSGFGFAALYFAFFLIAAKCDGTWPF